MLNFVFYFSDFKVGLEQKMLLILSSPCSAKSTVICKISLEKVSIYYDRLKNKSVS